MVDPRVASVSSGGRRRRRIVSVAGAAVALIAITAGSASIVGAATARTSVAAGSRPAPGSSGLPIFFFGSFTDPRWSGSIELVLTSDGKAVRVDGIAPGTCTDKDFGQLVAGKDGATGAVFGSERDATVKTNGSFSVNERRSGQRHPFKPLRQVVVSGTFSGNTVRGKLRAHTTSTFDDCTASGSFVARRKLH